MGIILLNKSMVYLFTWLHWLNKECGVNYSEGMGLSIQGQEPFESDLLMELFM